MTPKKNRPDLRQHALDLLSRREYAEQELYQRLLAAGHDADAVAHLVTDFVQRGWLSDQRYAEQVVRARASRYGSRRIEQELRSRGVSGSAIDAALSDSDVAQQATLARQLWQKKFGQKADSPQERARQIRFLVNRGFAMALVMKIVGGDGDEWPEG